MTYMILEPERRFAPARFTFETVLKCTLQDGNVHTLHGYLVEVEAIDSDQAREAIGEIATEMVRDDFKSLAAPLDRLEVVSAEIVQ